MEAKALDLDQTLDSVAKEVDQLLSALVLDLGLPGDCQHTGDLGRRVWA
ncbi:MAG: hypothetical protein U0936_03635 [Planctomycetaceae bacterium]